jgi:hypothetical protein
VGTGGSPVPDEDWRCEWLQAIRLHLRYSSSESYHFPGGQSSCSEFSA